MLLKPTVCGRLGAKNCRRGGFTLAEVLAALVFMAIVIPVTIEAVRIASQVGQVGERRAAAARIADRVLNEMMVTDGFQQATRSGTVEEGTRRFDWKMRSETWSRDSMNLITVDVTYNVQGRSYDLSVSTLYDTATQNTMMVNQ